MQRTDYIMRMIERLGAVLIGIRKRILGQEASAEEIQSDLFGAASLGGVDFTLARAATPEMLRLLLSKDGEVDPARAWTLIQLFELDALDAQERGDMDRAAQANEQKEAIERLLPENE